MQKSISLADLRKEYQMGEISPEVLAADPLLQFQTWMTQAIEAEQPEPTAMFLATVNSQGLPSGRVVLLKEVNPQGFVFYTNAQSRKGSEIAQNAAVALTFFWVVLERQVRVEGRVHWIDEAIATAYFQSRPRDSQIGAWASPQSQPVPDRETLEALFAQYRQQFEGQALIPKPPHWGGYCVVPEKVEFWQGRASRLHDRVLYNRQTDGSWAKTRLAP
jgi:pyridoxamine 5'-phosphate oxidase